MSKFTLQIKLKQHTPIIHFESLQEATIRATELKPKLDRFLIEKAKSSKDDYALWKKSKDHNALNYKVKVIVNGSVKREEIGNETLYFGNLGKNKRTEKGDKPEYSFVSGKDAIVLEFFSFNVGLLGFIKKHFGEFIFKTNFGTRQNKGFGSFFIEDDDEDVLTSVKKLRLNSYYLPIELEPNVDKQYIRVFAKIKKFYDSLKSGLIDETFTYSSKNIASEKKFLNNKKNFSSQEKQESRHTFYRVLLGLAGNYKEGKIAVSSKEIERFASPITFKPLKINDTHWRVYIHAEIIPEKLYDHQFKFTLSNSYNKDERFTLLQTPSEYFDINDLLSKFKEEDSFFDLKIDKTEIKI